MADSKDKLSNGTSHNDKPKVQKDVSPGSQGASFQKLEATMRMPQQQRDKNAKTGSFPMPIDSKPPEKSKAAERIIERLERTKAKASATQENVKQDISEEISGPGGVLALVPKRSEGTDGQQDDQAVIEQKDSTTDVAKSEENREIEISLAGEMAQIAQAMEQKMLKESQIVSAFITQVKLEKRQESQPILQILREDRVLSDKQCKQLQSIEKKQVKHKNVATRQLDFALGQLLIEQQILRREELQQIFKIQVNLSKLGISRSLESLLIASKAVPQDLLEPFAARFRTTSQVVIRKDKILSGFQTKPIAVVFWTLAMTVLFFLSLGGLLLLQVYNQGKREAQKKVDADRAQKSSQASNLQRIPLPKTGGREIRPQPVIDPTEDLLQKQQTRGLEKWGKHWISQEHKKALLTQGWREGSNLQKLSYKLSADIQSREQDGKCIITVKGRFDELPELPMGLHLQMEIQLLHAFRQIAVATPHIFELDKNHKFTVRLGPYPKILAPNLYVMRFSLSPLHQDKFLRDFFQIRENQVWWSPFLVKDTAPVQNSLGEHKSRLEKILKSLGAYHDEMRELSKYYQKLGKTPKDKLRSHWEKKSAKWQRELANLQVQLAKQYEPLLLPIFPCTEQQLPNLLIILNTIYNEWDNWHRDQNPSLPDMEREHIEFEIQLARNTLLLVEEYNKLIEILRQTTKEN